MSSLSAVIALTALSKGLNIPEPSKFASLNRYMWWSNAKYRTIEGSTEVRTPRKSSISSNKILERKIVSSSKLTRMWGGLKNDPKQLMYILSTVALDSRYTLSATGSSTLARKTSYFFRTVGWMVRGWKNTLQIMTRISKGSLRAGTTWTASNPRGCRPFPKANTFPKACRFPKTFHYMLISCGVQDILDLIR